ncbi:Pectinesterase [Theobroma cacao]|nr:Pectinesterase [Theobroma cacao]
MMGKVVVSGISIILVVGVVIGVVAVVHRNGDDKADLSPQMKAVSNFCSSTDYQEACKKTLSSVNSTDPKDYVAQAILASQEAVKKFFNYSDSLIVQAKNDSRTKMALDDCKEMMDYAIQSLQASFSEVGDGELRSINDRIADLRTWLSAVISYQQSCLDGFEPETTMHQTMTTGIADASELTANALAIVTKLSDILSKFGLQLAIPTARRLLSVEKDGYPSWFSAADRKLLARIDNRNLRPNAVVAKDGSGQFRTIAAALAAAPKNSKVRHVIYIKAGIYNEYITVDKKTTNILMYGDGPRKTIVTGHKNFVDGTSTWQTATFSAIGDGFIAKSMGFQNTAGPQKHQAVALRIQSDKSAFFNCRMDGYQDTLYNQANRQFFRNCVISGTIDFIFGDSPTIIQNSLIIVRRPMDNQQNTVTAQGKTNAHENTGTVIQNCRIVPEQKLFADRFKIPTYLGRPWKQYSTTVIMESTLGDFIQPAGWLPWAGSNFLNTLYYAEYNNRGPGANTAKRVNWNGYHRIDRRTAMRFTVQSFLLGRENWLPATGIPFTAGLRY